MQLNEGLEVLGADNYTSGVLEGSAVESVILPSTLRRIEYRAFHNCEKLKSISLPEGLEFIGPTCFRQSALESVKLPASLRMISQFAFAKCSNLKTVKFSEGLEVLGVGEDTDKDLLCEDAFDGSAIESVQLPSTLRRIEYNAFDSCENLKSVTLPNGSDALD